MNLLHLFFQIFQGVHQKCYHYAVIMKENEIFF